MKPNTEKKTVVTRMSKGLGDRLEAAVAGRKVENPKFSMNDLMCDAVDYYLEALEVSLCVPVAEHEPECVSQLKRGDVFTMPGKYIIDPQGWCEPEEACSPDKYQTGSLPASLGVTWYPAEPESIVARVMNQDGDYVPVQSLDSDMLVSEAVIKAFEGAANLFNPSVPLPREAIKELDLGLAMAEEKAGLLDGSEESEPEEIDYKKRYLDEFEPRVIAIAENGGIKSWKKLSFEQRYEALKAARDSGAGAGGI